MKYEDNYYAILGIKMFSSTEEVRQAYLKLAKIHHPDHGGNDTYMQILNEAYDILYNPSSKKQYDEYLLRKIREDINQSVNYGTYTYQRKADKEYHIHLLTIEGKVVHQYVFGSKFTFDYTKYLDEYGELYFYEVREGSKISTVITYKHIWLDMVKTKSEKPSGTISPSFSWSKIFLMFLIITSVLGTLYYCTHDENEPYKNTSNTYSSPVPSVIPTPTPEPQLLPDNGYIFKEPSQERIAPFKIDATQTSSNYYLVLKYYGEDRSRDMVFFVQGNNTLEIDVPLGKYELMCCCGETWYGQEYKFLNNSYQKAEDLLDFYTEGDYIYYETITLYPVANGNLEFEQINPEEFSY